MQRLFVYVVLLASLAMSITGCGQQTQSNTLPTAAPVGSAAPSEATPLPAAPIQSATAEPIQTAEPVQTTIPETPATTSTQAATSAVPAATEGATETTESSAETATASPDYGRTLTIMTHDSFDASTDVITEFERDNKVNLRFLKSGDAGGVLNRAILAKGSPLADVLYGVDNTFFSRAITSDIFEPYKPATLVDIPTDLQLDPQSRLVPIDYGYVNFNYDKAAFGEGKLPVPETLRDLTKPVYKGKIVVPSPATSSPGLAFLLTTIATFGEDGDYPWTKYWQDLKANDIQVVDGWETAYYTNFSGSSGKGPQPLVLSYATSPAAEVYFSEGKLQEPPTANFLPSQGTWRQIEFAGILKGTKNLELAQRWIDYMTGPRFQADIPLKMFVYPANKTAPLPELFEKFAQVPTDPATLPPDEIAQKRDGWIREWTRLVQR